MSHLSIIGSPLAGRAAGLYPASRVCSRALMPMMDLEGGTMKPLVHVLIEEALNGLGWKHNGGTAATEPVKQPEEEAKSDGPPASPSASSSSEFSICLVVRSMSEQLQIESYFHPEKDTSAESKADTAAAFKDIHAQLTAIGSLLHFIVQDAPLGLGDAILLAREWVGAEPFLVVSGDRLHITSHPAGRGCAKQLLDAYAHFGANGSGAMVLGVGPIESDELEGETLTNGALLTGVDLYASHTDLQRRIAEQHKQHGLDLAKIAAQNEGISRFTPAAMAAKPPPPPEATQGELYRVEKLAEHVTEEQAKKDFRVERPKSTLSASSAYGYPDLASHARALSMGDSGSSSSSSGGAGMEYLGCVGLDVLTPAVFEVLKRMKDEAAAAAGTIDSAAAKPPRPILSLRRALTTLLTSASPTSASSTPTSLFSLRLIGSHYSLRTPASFARALQACRDESAERKQVQEDAGMLSVSNGGKERKQEIIGPPSKDLPQRSGAPPSAASSPQAAAGAAGQNVPASATSVGASPPPASSPSSNAQPVAAISGYPGMAKPAPAPAPVVVGYPGMKIASAAAAQVASPPAASPITASNAASRRVAYD